MSFVNPIDYTGFSSPFNIDLAVNARNKADAYTKSQAALRAGTMGGAAASFLGKAQGQKFMDEAGAYAQQQGQNADMFGKAMGAVSGIGSFAAMGGFGGGAQMKGPSVGTFDGAFNSNLDIGGFTPSEILTNPNIGYNPFGG
jgi:hypothetical protein